MKECVQFYINGEWVDPVNPQHLDVINPATEESIGKIAMGNSEDVIKQLLQQRMLLKASLKHLRKRD